MSRRRGSTTEREKRRIVARWKKTRFSHEDRASEVNQYDHMASLQPGEDRIEKPVVRERDTVREHNEG